MELEQSPLLPSFLVSHQRAKGPEATIVIGLVGAGNIGSELARSLVGNWGREKNIFLKNVAVKDLYKPRNGLSLPLTNDAMAIASDPEVDLLVEVMGGADQAVTVMYKAISCGKSVVTANKRALAEFPGLLQSAKLASVDLFFEAAVGGGIDEISSIQNILRGDSITASLAINNGTDNYILTEMRKGLPFQQVLQEAITAGYAEPEYWLDTQGFDSQDKTAVLASWIFNIGVKASQVHREGIDHISPIDIEFAKSYKDGYAIKLLSEIRSVDGKILTWVSPALIRASHRLATVDGAQNAFLFLTESAGELMYTGKGAGPKPTASALRRNIDLAARNIRWGIQGIDILPSQVRFEVMDPMDYVQAGYFRCYIDERPDTYTHVANVIGRNGIRIGASIPMDYITETDGRRFEADITTIKPTSRRVIQKTQEELGKLDVTTGDVVFIPFANL